jgi:hypothetical protein
VRIILVNEFSDLNSPVTKLVYDLGAALTVLPNTTVIQLNLRTKYRPGGLRWQRIGSMGLMYMIAPVIIFCHLITSKMGREKFCVVVTTTPPLLHWILLLLSAVLKFRVIVWYQDAHPEIEVRILRRRGFFMLARILAGVDVAILKMADRIVVLDDAMFDLITVGRKIPSECVKISAPWSTFASPGRKMRQPNFSSTGVINLIYAGNYGFTHDISPLAMGLGKLSAKQRAQVSITGIGMNAPSQLRFKELFRDAGIEVKMLPRSESFQTLLHMFDHYDFGLVSLREDSAGLAAPSKAYTYLSQGLPILYVGPKKSLPDKLVQQGFGVSTGEFIAELASGFFSNLKSCGSVIDDPKHEAMKVMMRVIYG